MLKIIKSRMSIYNFSEFKKDYDNLIQYKKNEELWKKVLKSRLPAPPIFKDYFSVLGNKYDYTFYRDIILNNDFDIDNLLEETKESEIKEGLKLFYVTDTYIGFIVEELLFSSLSELNIDIKRDNYLDRYKKTDIIIDKREIQIKNISFLENKNNFDRLRYYQQRNRNLYFLFYKVTKDNIYFITVNDKPLIFNVELAEIMNFCRAKNIQFNDFIALLL